MGLHEVIELLANSIMAHYEVVQTVLSITPIFVETTANNLPKCEVMGSGDEKDSRRRPRQCCDVSKVSEANWSPLTAMSSRCSQTATWRPWHGPRPSRPQYPQMRHWTHTSLWQAAKVLLPAGSTGDRVVETLALLVRWYLAIMQTTWFLSLLASRGRISGCKCLMARPATSSRGGGCSPAYS